MFGTAKHATMVEIGYLAGTRGQILVNFGGHTLLYNFRRGFKEAYLPVHGSGKHGRDRAGERQAAMHRGSVKVGVLLPSSDGDRRYRRWPSTGSRPHSARDDEGVDCDRAVGAADQRVDVEGVDVLAELAGELGQAGDGADDRGEVGWRRAAGAGEQRGDLELGEQPGGLITVTPAAA